MVRGTSEFLAIRGLHHFVDRFNVFLDLLQLLSKLDMLIAL